MLDKETKQNLEQYLALIESPIVFSVSLDNSENSQKLAEFTKEIAEMSPKISWEKEIRCAHLVFYQSSWQRKWNRFCWYPPRS
ncbi:hypothetical protein LOS23_12885 [Enterococcus faecium]|nr:hypothetical protein [Enterococcus faecium]